MFGTPDPTELDARLKQVEVEIALLGSHLRTEIEERRALDRMVGSEAGRIFYANTKVHELEERLAKVEVTPIRKIGGIDLPGHQTSTFPEGLSFSEVLDKLGRSSQAFDITLMDRLSVLYEDVRNTDPQQVSHTGAGKFEPKPLPKPASAQDGLASIVLQVLEHYHPEFSGYHREAIARDIVTHPAIAVMDEGGAGC